MKSDFDRIETESDCYACIIDTNLGFDVFGNFFFRLHLKCNNGNYISVTFGIPEHRTDITDNMNKITLSALKELLDMLNLKDFNDLKGEEIMVKTLNIDYTMFKVIAIQSNSGNKEINLSMFNQYF
jgi:hypothetical protein